MWSAPDAVGGGQGCPGEPGWPAGLALLVSARCPRVPKAGPFVSSTRNQAWDRTDKRDRNTEIPVHGAFGAFGTERAERDKSPLGLTRPGSPVGGSAILEAPLFDCLEDQPPGVVAREAR